MCRRETYANTITQVVTQLAKEVLGPNPKRKSFMLSPVANSLGQQGVIATVFPPSTSAGVVWTPPTGVTTITDLYCIGAGGNGSIGNATFGGGGGGGGAWANSGALDIPANTTITVIVDSPVLGVGNSTVNDTFGIFNVLAQSGSNAAGATEGFGGTTTLGASSETGGNGANGLALNGGGGGGSAGALAGGNSATNATGGAATAVLGLLGLGAGGAGGNGAPAVGGIGANGSTPGGGGGGGGLSPGDAGGIGAPGVVIIFYPPTPAMQAMSLSLRPDVQPGQGILNYLPGATFPTIVDDCQVGNAIGQPWWGIAGMANCTIQITEFSYADESDS